MSDLASSITRLETSLSTRISSSFDLDEAPDVVELMLGEKRSPATRREYRKDINKFFQAVAHKPPSRDLVLEFLHLEQAVAVRLVLSYKSQLIERGLAKATVNRRLSAIKALTAQGRKIGVCNYTLEDVKPERTKAYRDTTGVDKDDFIRVLSIPDTLKDAVYSQRSRIKAVRDYALLRLLWSNALRREEISLTNVNDFDAQRKTLSIMGKGQGTEREAVSLSPKTAIAITDWLDVRGEVSPESPLFIAIDNAHYGQRLSGGGIYGTVSSLCKEAGIDKQMSPHRIRHGSITAALDATNGNLRKVQKLSRHKDINTVMIYDDNRTNYQGEVTQLLDDLV
ncbi:MAG: tyrosine-type recombinase/integrase [Cyanobacteria bacterium J06648_1]